MKNTKNILTKIRKYFPQVNEVIDAKKSITIQVQKRDSKEGKKKSPQSCAMAKACMRCFHADGAIINIGFSYIIKGEVATRYKTSVSVAREIVSFDRHQDFAPGRDYILGKVSNSAKLGSRLPKPYGPHTTKRKEDKPIIHKHKTTRIRVAGAE